MKNIFILFLLLAGLYGNAQTDTLALNYFHRSPFAYNENGNPRGIEVDIMNEFVLWLKAKKKIDIAFRYQEYNDYGAFFAATKSGGKNCIGLGSTPVSADKAKEVDFTTPYLRNVAFCITNGHAPDVKTKSADEVVRSLGSMNALTIPNTNLNRYVNDIKKKYIQDLRIVFHSDEVKILDEISKNVLAFGYVDAIGFWFYVKNNPHKFLKMQKILSQSTDELAFMLPKNSRFRALFNEFFAGPGGFKNLPAYRAILERHLGSYMTQNVAVN